MSVTLEEARQYAQEHGINTTTKWLNHDRPQGMPSRPDLVYDIKWREFFQKGRPCLPYDEARRLVFSLGIKSVLEYRLMGRNGVRPAELPAGPQEYYGDEWRGWPHFLSKTED